MTVLDSPAIAVEPTAEPPIAAAGHELVAGYRALRLIRRGVDLDVYDAWSESRQCRCVLKTVRPDRERGTRVVARLRFEAELLLGLSHPHLVRAYEYVDHPVPTLVLETLTGETVAHLVDRRGRLTLREGAVMGYQLCSALQYVHRSGVVHLDLKPSNVVAEAGRAKLLDLSLARAPGRVPAGIGSCDYLSPEQAGGGEVCWAADVWGLGLVVVEALTGTRIYDHPTDPGTGRYLQLTRRPPPVGTLRRLPRALTTTLDACFGRCPRDRPTLAEVSAVLAAFVD